MCELYDMWIYLNKSTKNKFKEEWHRQKGKKAKNKPINNLGLTIVENKIQTCF